MDKVMTYLSMGGRGDFIWPAYLIAAVVMIALLVSSLRSARTQEARLAALRKARRGVPEKEDA